MKEVVLKRKKLGTYGMKTYGTKINFREDCEVDVHNLLGVRKKET